MKKVYFAGKFNLLSDKTLSLAERLVNDFRSKILGDSKLLTFAEDNLKLNDNYIFSGPFYCEQASNGDFTSNDCNVVLNEEKKAVSNCDIYLAVFGEKFSVGTIVELGWALNLDKEIVILYQEEESVYQIKSEYWFAIADGLNQSNKIKVFKYKKEEEIVDIINKELLDK